MQLVLTNKEDEFDNTDSLPRNVLCHLEMNIKSEGVGK